MRATKSRFDLWIKSSQAGLLAIAICFSVGSNSGGSRVDKLSHQLMCQCGCAQLLGECDHVGCPDRGKEVAELNSAIASGQGDEEIFTNFSTKYGATVLAAPTTHGFDLVAWIAPLAVFAAALMGTILLVRHWTGARKPAPAPADTSEMDALRDRVRRETDSGNDGGF